MNRITQILGTKLPVIAGGMAWCSGWRLASAVCNAGGLGVLGAGTMNPELLKEHIHKLKDSTDRPWAVNLPLMYPQMEELIGLIIDEACPVVITSAGSPAKFTSRFHDAGMKVAHVVSSSAFARKCEAAGVDIVIAEGFEAGGHNGKEETTTLCLIPQVREATSLPLVAAGGIASGQAWAAAQALGAEGVQIGTLFAMSEESSASYIYKEYCASLSEGGTMLCLKKFSPSRMAKNNLYSQIAEAEAHDASKEELLEILGVGATRRGIFEGDVENGEVLVGQICSSITRVEPVSVIMSRLVSQYRETFASMRPFDAD